METVVILDTVAAYVPSLQAVMQIADTPTTPQHKEQASGFGNVEPWGSNNLFPQEVLAAVRKSTILAPGLDFKSRAMYQGGLQYGYLDYVEKPEETIEVFRPKKDPKVEAFLNRNRHTRYLIEALTDFYYFFNQFPELVLTKDRREIYGLTSQEATYSRWSKQNPKTGLVDSCYISAAWETARSEEDPLVTAVPVIDPYYAPVEKLRDDSRGFKYIYPTSYPTPGCTFYQLAHWDSVRTSGWLSNAQLIPTVKEAIQKNQIVAKYLIEVSTWWWNWKYSGFDKMGDEAKRKIMQKELETFQQMMAGAENAGNSIMNTFHADTALGKEYPGWRITAIDNKIKDGLYLEDSQEASSHLLFALGLDPSLIGATPGKGQGAGSGSDKNAAFNAYISLCSAHEAILLEVFHFIRDFNGWDPNYTFRFKRQILSPQTSGKPQLQNVK